MMARPLDRGCVLVGPSRGPAPGQRTPVELRSGPLKGKQEDRRNMSASARFRRVASGKADANVAGAGPAGSARQNSGAGGTVHPPADPDVRPKSWWATARSARPARAGGTLGYDCDVVVVGGGPAGAAAAARLAGAGFATVVVDRASFPRTRCAGTSSARRRWPNLPTWA